MTVFEAEAENFEMWMSDIKLNHGNDPEVCHEKMDELMCETLEKFGCYAGVEVFRNVKKVSLASYIFELMQKGYEVKFIPTGVPSHPLGIAIRRDGHFMTSLSAFKDYLQQDLKRLEGEFETRYGKEKKNDSWNI